MKSFIIFNVILSSCFIGLVLCEECTYSPGNYNPFYPDIFLQPIKNKSLLIGLEEDIPISDEGYIEVYCNRGFKYSRDCCNYYEDEQTDVKSIIIECKNENMEYILNETKRSVHGEKIKCDASHAALYPVHKLRYCNHTGFMYGIHIRNTSIVFIEFCYNIKKSNLIFTHFAAAKRSPYIEEQEQYNPSNIPVKLDSMQKFVFPNKPRKIPNEVEENQFNFKTFAGSVDFEIGELVQFEKYVKIFEKFLGDTSEVNTVIWWSPLRNGNWELFEKLLEKEAMENDLDVFAGKSGIVTYPYDDKCSITTELLLEVHGSKRSVPLLIWNYVRPKDAQGTEDDVVILGVNSPFFEIFEFPKQGNGDNITMICRDICDTIAWLEQLNKTRKMAAFGYIFCCKPEQVKNVLDGFPSLELQSSEVEQYTETNLVKRYVLNPTTN